MALHARGRICVFDFEANRPFGVCVISLDRSTPRYFHLEKAEWEDEQRVRLD